MKYLIASINGVGNSGDDLIARVIIDMLESIDPAAEIKLTRPPFDAALSVWADATIVGGGGLLYDHDVMGENVRNYMLYIDAAAVQQKPAYVVGAGEQGIVTARGRERYRKYLDKAGLITVRSRQDKAVLSGQVGTKTPVVALQDLVFALDVRRATERWRRIRRLVGLKPVLGFNLARLSSQGQKIHLLDPGVALELKRYEDYLAPAHLKSLFRDFRVKLICQSRDDLKYYQQLHELYGAKIIYPETFARAPKLLEAYQGCDLILTGRFHGLVIAALLGKPVATVGLGGQKLDKLISERLSSLRKSFYTPAQFAGQEVLAHLKQFYRSGHLPSAKSSQVAVCQRLARANKAYLQAALKKDLGIK